MTGVAGYAAAKAGISNITPPSTFPVTANGISQNVAKGRMYLFDCQSCCGMPIHICILYLPHCWCEIEDRRRIRIDSRKIPAIVYYSDNIEWG